jgi:uncharacterized membrane protein YkoI
MYRSLRFLLPVLVLLALSGARVRAAEKRISKKELPPAVQKTADEETQHAAVRGYSKDTENGQLEYEVQMVTNGHTKDVTIAPDGRVLEIEEEVRMDSLRPEVRSGLEAQAGMGKITKVESLTKHGAIVAYEAQVSTSGKHSEVQVGSDGKDLDHPE